MAENNSKVDEFYRAAISAGARDNISPRGLREGWLRLHIDRTFPLAQAAEAHQLLESRQTAGKLILTTN